ncbi:MAG: transporter [Opitutales bacterium]
MASPSGPNRFADSFTPIHRARRLPVLIGITLLGLALDRAVYAQNTGMVFSPDVTRAAPAMDGRLAYDPDADAFAQRIHYQYGLSDAFRVRGILAFRSDDAESGDFRFFRFEGLYQFLEDGSAGFDSAIRVGLQFADGDDPPSRVRISWANKVQINADWQLRGILLTGHRFGPQSPGGYLLQARAQVSRKLSDSLSLALDYFGDFNTTDDIGSFDEQEHQLGPALKFDLTDRLGGLAGVLFGLSEATPDTEFRISLAYAL